MYCYIFIEHLPHKDFMDVHLFTLRTVQIQKPMVKRNLCGVYVAVHVGGRGTLATGRKFRQIPKNSLKDISQIKYKKR